MISKLYKGLKMNQDKFEFNLAKILKMYPNAHTLNKTQVQFVLKISASTWARREKLNDKYALPQARQINYKCSNRSYNGYSYDVYELAIFMTDRDYYWSIIEVKGRANDR